MKWFYNVTFIGREFGAVGIFYKQSLTVIFDVPTSNKDVLLKVYDNYEHISEFKITTIRRA